MKKHKKKSDKKKLQDGGFLNYLKKNPTAVGQIGGVAGSLVGSVAGHTADGAMLSGALSGIGAGAASGPIGMGVGAVVGGGMSLLQQQKQKKAEEEAERLQQQAEKLAHKDWSKSILKNYATEGIAGTNYYKKGGSIKGDYEVEKDEVVQGFDTRLEEGNKLASDLDLVGGNTHEQGGTEGIGGERVYSDHLKTVAGKTFAETATKLGRQKGKFEKKYNTRNVAANNTADRMIGRIEEDLDNLFTEQENMKAFAKVAKRKFWDGGIIDPKNDKQVREAQQRLLNSGYDLGKTGVDGDWGKLSQTAWESYNNMMNTVKPKLPDPTLAPPPSTNPYIANVTGKATASGIETQSAPEMKEGVAGQNAIGTYATKAMQGISAVAPFFDNIVNSTLRTPAIPKPIRQGHIRLNKNVDVNPELKAIDDAQRNFNLGIEGSTSSNAVARANKASAFARTLDAKGSVYRTKRAEENTIENQETAMNAQIDAQNNALTNDHFMKVAMRQDDVNRRTSQNVAELSQNIQGIQRDKKMDDMDIQRLKMTMEKNPDVFVSMLDTNPELLGKYYDADFLEARLDKVKGTANEAKLKKIIAEKKANK